MSDKKFSRNDLVKWLSSAGTMLKASFTSNLHVKLLSLALAFVVWPIMMINADPMRTRIVESVPVSISNMEVFTNMGYATVKNIYNEIRSVNVEISVSQKEWEALKVQTELVTASINMSRVTGTGKQSLPIVVYTPNGNVMKCSPPEIEVVVEERISKPISVMINATGLPDHYMVINDPRPSVNIVNVFGAESVVESIEQARVDVDYSQLLGNVDQYSSTYEIAFVDKDGNAVDSDNLSITEGRRVIVTGLIRPTKEVPVVLRAENFTGLLAKDYELKLEGSMYDQVTEVEPYTVVVAAPQSVLDTIDSVEFEPINIEGLTGDTTEMKKIVVPAGVNRVVPSEVRVDVVIAEKWEKRSFADVDLEVRGVKPGTEVYFDEVVVPYVEIEGPLSLFRQFERKDVVAYLDVSSYSVGIHTVNVQVEIRSDIDIVGGSTREPSLKTVQVEIRRVGEP